MLNTVVFPATQRRALAKYPQSNCNSPILSPGKRRRKDVGDYWLGKTLGRGSSGRVKMGIHKVTGEKVAVKIISKQHLATNASVEKAVKREIAVMKLINHPYIMRLIDVIDMSDSPNLYLILEYVQGGELFEYLVSQGRLPENEARRYFQQIIIGLDYCHRHLICHRDLKPENLLFDQDRNIKIADFGMASLQPTGSMLETSCGSPHYASPEIVNGIRYNGAASDIWSCGIILYALLCGHLPFDDDNIRQLLTKVKLGNYTIPDYVSSEARDLIRRILVVNPAQRLTMQQVQEHPWFVCEQPPNPSKLPDPPSAEEIGRPVSSVNDIDNRILETLKVLWSDLSTEQVIKALLNIDHNMQKVAYVLLQRHAINQLQKEVVSPSKRRRRPATVCVVSDKSSPLSGLDHMVSKLTTSNDASNNFTVIPEQQAYTYQTPNVNEQMPTQAAPYTTRPHLGYDEAVPPLPLKPLVVPVHPWLRTPNQPRRRNLWHSPNISNRQMNKNNNVNKFLPSIFQPSQPLHNGSQSSISNQQNNTHRQNARIQYAQPTGSILNHTPNYHTVSSASPDTPDQQNNRYSAPPPINFNFVQQNRAPYQFPWVQQQQDSKLMRFMNMLNRTHRVNPNQESESSLFKFLQSPKPFNFEKKPRKF
ncbi:kinase-like domain-containing protein [Mycotypha africana]|uniref:kinase-like domain-containing protein n=1 Tax=Mycotypha africana TaxID=64632 RepID=UPI0023013788|nr:kinase-like domain-containing protein [Mycotypha africana]KAI8968159.1 kinase-like domain-containing protein [Mycotypha africana]